VGVSFRESQHNSSKLVERPHGRDQGPGAGREGYLRASGHLLGLCSEEFWSQAAVPWNEAGLCGSLKETPTAQQSGNDVFSKC
jgi:hypothetical protein